MKLYGINFDRDAFEEISATMAEYMYDEDSDNNNKWDDATFESAVETYLYNNDCGDREVNKILRMISKIKDWYNSQRQPDESYDTSYSFPFGGNDY